MIDWLLSTFPDIVIEARMCSADYALVLGRTSEAAAGSEAHLVPAENSSSIAQSYHDGSAWWDMHGRRGRLSLTALREVLTAEARGRQGTWRRAEWQPMKTALMLDELL